MRHYWIELFDTVTGQIKHRSDFFDNAEDAEAWAKNNYGGPYDMGPEESWRLKEEAGETLEVKP